MRENAARLTDTEALECDICIVGGGPAGITVAMQLLDCDLSVVVLESGADDRETPDARDLNRGSVTPPGSHEALEENRRRQWGGASTAWGGRCVPFDGIDIAARSWVPDSGWPIAEAELEEYYRPAAQLCEIGDPEFSLERAVPGSSPLVPGLDGASVSVDRCERWSPPTDFGRAYGPALDDAGHRCRVRVVTDATVTGLGLDPDGGRVVRVDVATHDGHRLVVRPGVTVLAAGTLESTRLLLASTDVCPAGVGNEHDLVGRYYMSHLSGVFVTLAPSAQATWRQGFRRTPSGVYVRPRIWLTGPAQAEHRLLNAVFFAVRPPDGATGHRSALFSAVFLAKTVRDALATRSPRLMFSSARRPDVREHLGVVVHGAPRMLPTLVRLGWLRLAGRRRLPMVLPPDSDPVHHLYVQAEQAPHHDSRVTVDPGDRDALGMPRLVVHPLFSDEDVDSVVRAHELLRDELERAGVGRLDMDALAIREQVRASVDQLNSAAHQLGTTRMSVDARTGVVDPDLRVHGVENLYVVSGSVFPTGGHANPTLTIVALAVRLGRLLAERAGTAADAVQFARTD